MENGHWRIPKGRNESLGLDSANSTKTESELRGDGRKARRTKGIPWWWSRYSPRGLVCILFVDVDGSMEMGEGFAWWQRERVDFMSGFWFGGASRFHQILGAWKGGRREEGWIHCIRDQLEYGATRACLWAHVGVGEPCMLVGTRGQMGTAHFSPCKKRVVLGWATCLGGGPNRVQRWLCCVVPARVCFKDKKNKSWK